MAKKNNKNIVIGLSVVAIIVVAGLILLGNSGSAFPEDMDEFRNLANCMSEDMVCESEAPNVLLCEYDNMGLMGVKLPLFIEDKNVFECIDLITIMSENADVEEFLILKGKTIWKTISKITGEFENFFTCDDKTKFMIVGENIFMLNNFVNIINEGKPWECSSNIPTLSIVG